MLRFSAIALTCAMLLGAGPASAIVITPTSSPATLANALTSGSSGFSVVNTTLSGSGYDTTLSSGTYTNSSGTYGIGSGVVLSTGDVSAYGDGPNQSSWTSTFYEVPATYEQELLLDPVTGGGFYYYDVTQLDIDFTTSTGEVFFNVVFGTEEFDEFVGSQFIDGFGLYLDGINIAYAGGEPLNVNHPDMAFMSGTELDGLLAPNGNPLLTFGASNLSTSDIHTLTFILTDTSDSGYDTTVYISSLGGTPPVATPLPAAVWLFGSGLAGLGAVGRKKQPG